MADFAINILLNEAKMTNQHFNEYKPKLILEAILTAALCGIGVGFGTAFLLGLVFWIIGIKLYWIIIATALGVAVAVGAALYFLRFRPTDISNARRLDRLGLEERLVTMVELEGTDSYIANIQREDAKKSLGALDKKLIKLTVPKKILIVATSLFVLGAAAITANILAAKGIWGYAPDIFEDEFTEYVTVTYEVDDGGTIEGDDVQDIEKGTDTTSVTAVADEGFMFKEWSDGYTQPTRFEQQVNESITFTAIFIELEDEEGEEKEGDGEGDKDAQGEQGGQSDEEGDENGQSAPDGEFNPNATAGGGQREPSNQVIDGETFYKEVLEYYQELVNGQIEDNDGLTDEEIDLIKKYLGIV